MAQTSPKNNYVLTAFAGGMPYQLKCYRHYNHLNDNMELLVSTSIKSKLYHKKFVGGAYTTEVEKLLIREAVQWLTVLDRLLTNTKDES